MSLDRQFQIREEENAREAHFLQQSAGIDRTAAIRRWRGRCRATLLRDLQWPADETRRDRLVLRCVNDLETIARHVYQRGWLLKEDRLGELVKDCIRPITEAQRAGKVRDLYPYFKAAVERYVGMNAEEIQQSAKRSGADVATSMEALVAGLGRVIGTPAPTITEILAERGDQTALKARPRTP